jgi:hypothetical protein
MHVALPCGEFRRSPSPWDAQLVPHSVPMQWSFTTNPPYAPPSFPPAFQLAPPPLECACFSYSGACYSSESDPVRTTMLPPSLLCYEKCSSSESDITRTVQPRGDSHGGMVDMWGGCQQERLSDIFYRQGSKQLFTFPMKNIS